MVNADETRKLAQEYLSYVRKIRRDLHRNPEPSWSENRTSGVIERELESMGIKTKRFDRTGVVGEMTAGKPGKVIALRADMDALRLSENVPVPFRSENGFMHACGHDCHVAMLLGAARVLSDLGERIDGRIRFIFQPAEELAQGALYMIRNGVLDQVDGIFGMHVFPDMKCGQINVESGIRMAETDVFRITISGAGNPGFKGMRRALLGAAGSVIMNMQGFLSRYVEPPESSVFNMEQCNLVSGEISITGRCRSFSPETKKTIEEKIRQIVQSVTCSTGLKSAVEYMIITPFLKNHEGMSMLGADSVSRLFGSDSLVPRAGSVGGEDFAFYCEKIPGLFAFLGCGRPQDPTWVPNHSDMFGVDEGSLYFGTAFYAQFALDFLEKALKS